MKDTKICILIFATVFIIMYVAESFVFASFNMADWTLPARVFGMFFWLTTSAFACGMYLDSKGK